jgi:hypothetical protein
MSYIETIETALYNGAKMHCFLSGGGLRVVRLERNGKLVGYGEHPHLEDALSHAAEDYEAGGRDYAAVYGGDKPLYLTGSTQPTGPLDAWVRQGRTIDAIVAGNHIVVTMEGYGENRTPDDVAKRVFAGETVEWEARGLKFKSRPEPFPNGDPGCMTECLTRTARDAWSFRIHKRGRHTHLQRALELAIEAEEKENDGDGLGFAY